MRARNNHLPEIERLAEDLVRRAGYTTGALTHRAVAPHGRATSASP